MYMCITPHKPVSNIYADNAIHKLKYGLSACIYVASFPGSRSRKGEESLVTLGGGGGGGGGGGSNH